MITLRFATHWPPNPTSLIIALAAGSKQFSHVMTIIGDVAYEATMLHGCRAVPVDAAMDGVVLYQDMFVPVENMGACIAWGNAQIGKKYDFAGAFGIPFLMSDDWSQDDKWWCSEHAFMLLGEGGTWVLDKNEKTRVTPNDLHQCNFRKGEIVRVPR